MLAVPRIQAHLPQFIDARRDDVVPFSTSRSQLPITTTVLRRILPGCGLLAMLQLHKAVVKPTRVAAKPLRQRHVQAQRRAGISAAPELSLPCKAFLVGLAP